jgi:hypothetical protein
MSRYFSTDCGINRGVVEQDCSRITGRELCMYMADPINEDAFAHWRGLQAAHDEECRSKLRQLVEEGIRSGEIPADKAFADLRAEVNRLVP